MRLPQDIANLLAVAIRDLIWFRPSVIAFLEGCGVPRALIIEVRRRYESNISTIPNIHYVLDQLASKGEAGNLAVRKMLTEIYRWQDIHTVQADRKQQAIASHRALQTAYRKWEATQEYQKEQERKMQAERVVRTQSKPLDHNKLQCFRDEFDRIHSLKDAKKRGDELEVLMNEIFAYYSTDSKGPLRREGEQVDGQFYYDSHWYFVEVRWRTAKTNAGDVSELRDRARSIFAGDGRALFISFNGYSSECLESLKGRTDERVILMDGVDLRCILDCQIAFDVLLHEKQADIVRNKRPFISAADIILAQQK